MLPALLLLMQANTGSPTTPVTISIRPAAVGTCNEADVAKGAEIIAIGAYEGGLSPGFRADDGGHEIKAIEVRAAGKGRPFVLVLSAYDPVVWDLRAISRRRLRAVLVTGYHVQGVAGAGKTRVRFATRGMTECGPALHAYEGGPELDRLDERVEQIFGRPIDRFIGQYSPSYVTLDAGAAAVEQRPLLLADVRASGSYNRSPTAGGRPGLAQLLHERRIRPATRDDIARLDAARDASSRTGRLAPLRTRFLLNSYVVLGPITVPAGMYGAHAATFLLPPGVPQPIDPGSHNTYWRLDDGVCSGTGCRPGADR